MNEIQKLQRELEKEIAKSIDSGNLKPIAEETKQAVKDRTRSGKGVSANGGVEKDLKQLSESYKKQRQGIQLSPETAPDTSNLTQKGGMLDTLSASASQGNIEVAVSPQNQKKAEHVESGGRPFMYLSSSEIQDLEKSVSDSIESELSKHFKG